MNNYWLISGFNIYCLYVQNCKILAKSIVCKTPVIDSFTFTNSKMIISASIQNKLDNPVWFALQEKHAAFALGNNAVKRYEPSIAPFIAVVPEVREAFEELPQWVAAGETVLIFGNSLYLPGGFEITASLGCVQMLSTAKISVPVRDDIVVLGEADAGEMFSLISLIQPGYYLPLTRLMGSYAGIRSNGQLVAIAGERMRMEGLTELSAVVTHPAFTGRKYAQQLIAYITNQNIAAGNFVFLHAAASNTRAIALYEHLGFSLRKTVTLHKMYRNPQ